MVGGHFTSSPKEPVTTASAPHHDRIVVLSVNVTSLTKARLREVLDHASKVGANIIALQETRHDDGGPTWAKKVAADLDWRTQWSVQPPPNAGEKGPPAAAPPSFGGVI